MGRKEVSVEERRLQALMSPIALGISVREACKLAGWSKTQFYEFRHRYETEGIDGLRDRSSRPRACPHRTPQEIEEMVCRLRVANPDWGPRRIRDELVRAGSPTPAISTIGQILVREGLVTPRPRKRKKFIRFERPCPNDLWQIDAIEFTLAGGTDVYLINILDDHARFLLASRSNFTVDGKAALEAFEAAEADHGAPREFLSDNARCFSGKHWGLVAELERELWSRGVNTIASTPMHPQTLGKLERMHRTQRSYIEGLGALTTLSELQKRADAFRWDYNETRPNQALGVATTPAERYRASAPARPLGSDNVRLVTRKVRNNGTIQYSGWTINLTSEWAGAIVDLADGGGKVRITSGEELITSFSTEEPQGYIGTGIRRGHNPLPRRSLTR